MGFVRGHFKKDGTFVSSHYRNKRGGGSNGMWISAEEKNKAIKRTNGCLMWLVGLTVLFFIAKSCN